MKHTILRCLALTLCISAALLGLVLTAAAEDCEIIVNSDTTIDVTVSDQNHSYVYLNAEVPNGWGGNIETRFHNRSSGKDYSLTMNYIQDEYNSGIWLPFGQYTVSVSLPDDDGMCLVHMDDESQSTLQIKKGEDIRISLSVTENPDFSFPESTSGEHIVPPPAMEDISDLPTVSAEADETSETVTLPSELETTEDSHSNTGAIVVASILVAAVIICAVFIFVLECKHLNEY